MPRLVESLTARLNSHAIELNTRQPRRMHYSEYAKSSRLSRRTNRLNRFLATLRTGIQIIPAHAQAREIRTQIGEPMFSSYYKFAFVRDPWDWQVSLYHFIRASEAHRDHAVVGDMGFEAYLEWRVSEDLRLQRDMISDADGQSLVDFVGKLEQLETDFDHVCRSIGVQAQLAHLNRSEHRPYTGYYDARTARLIAQHFAPDIELFGYSFPRA